MSVIAGASERPCEHQQPHATRLHRQPLATDTLGVLEAFGDRLWHRERQDARRRTHGRTLAHGFHRADSRDGCARDCVRDLLACQARAIAQRRSPYAYCDGVTFADAEADAATADTPAGDADIHPNIHANACAHTEPEPNVHLLRDQGRR
jgi:hypothetical protein